MSKRLANIVDIRWNNSMFVTRRKQNQSAVSREGSIRRDTKLSKLHNEYYHHTEAY